MPERHLRLNQSQTHWPWLSTCDASPLLGAVTQTDHDYRLVMPLQVQWPWLTLTTVYTCDASPLPGAVTLIIYVWCLSTTKCSDIDWPWLSACDASPLPGAVTLTDPDYLRMMPLHCQVQRGLHVNILQVHVRSTCVHQKLGHLHKEILSVFFKKRMGKGRFERECEFCFKLNKWN